MVDSETEKVLLQGLEQARAKGWGEVELYLLSGRSLSVKVRKDNLEDFQDARSAGLGVRVIVEHRCGYSYTEDLSQSAVNSAIEKASRLAALNPPDEHNFLEAPGESYPPFEQVDREIEETPIALKVEMARRLERTAMSVDDRIVNVPDAEYGDGRREVAIISSRGMFQTYVRNGAGISIGLMAREGEEIKSPFKYRYSSRLGELDPDELARETAREALARLGAKQAASGNMPVVFNNEAARELLAAFSGIFSARSVQKGLSLLKGKLGMEVGSKVVSIRDDGLFPAGVVSRPFDDEGTPSQDTPLIENGVLKNFLHNRYTASIDGVRSTGNASRGSISASLEVAPSNFYLVPGEGTAEGLMEEAGEGVLVVDLQGLHSGTNAISGDFSLGAQGYYFKSGKVSHPVHNFTVAGNFLKLLSDLSSVAGDLEFSYPRGNSSIGSPSFLVSRLAVSGE
jgi:PmbA protein